MDDNYLWEIFTNKQNISEDHGDHHHQLLQIPNFQLNGFCQQTQIHNQDLISDPHVSLPIITPQFQTSCDQLYKSLAVKRSTSIITPQFQTSCDRLYKSSVNTSTSIIAPHHQFPTSCDQLYKSSVSTSTSIFAPDQFQTSCDRLYKSSVSSGSSNLDDDNKKGLRSDESNKLKKVVHRNVERQRRQEMANLVASLRSLIPFEFIKGGRSTSDHMQVAVNYIKQLQKNIEELDNRRKKLKNISLDDQNKSSTNYAHNHNNNCVTVNKCEDDMEILINVNNSHKEEIFSLSKVLRWLLEEGLTVVSCVSSKHDEWTLIRIQCRVSDISSGLTAAGLQKKLTDVINWHKE
ncbi:transcription factor bHLH125-like [Lycium ferocissimum]|uniref:transcription factor bHLH125-like n=1 Tax=Lycium ferocissimum TaxID=112874 RepID=UPI002815E3ED|nr:transcription factor bHLH125-like [Lycium ferocissimum]